MKDWVNQYLKILSLEREEPTYEFLQKLCYAHLNRIPFENISKLIYFQNYKQNHFYIPTPEMFVDHIKMYDFGGTCFSINSNLLFLLKELGFQCYHVMLSEKHIGIIVRFEETNERVYVDCGAAAPFFSPLKIEDELLTSTTFGYDEVRIIQNTEQPNRYNFVRYMKGNISGDIWEFDINKSYEIENFSTIIHKANQPNTTFMKMLRCQLWQVDKNRSLSLVNNVLTIRYADHTDDRIVLRNKDEIEEVIHNEFGLNNLPVKEAIVVLEELGIDIYQSI
jgi:arylamine N-acetyltransferase